MIPFTGPVLGKPIGRRYPPGAFDQVWFWRAKLGERKGERCRVLARGAMQSVLVEFEDGFRVVTGRHAIRRARA